MANEHIDLIDHPDVYDWLYPIYVPTYTRAGTAPLLNLLSHSPPEGVVTLVVREEERTEYMLRYPWADTVVVKRPGLGPARSRALAHAFNRGHRRIVMMDDDIKHVSLLERIKRDDGKLHTRRHSTRVSGIPEPDLMLQSLSVACRLSSAVFDERPWAVYGACRNALFSGDVDTDIGATLNRGTFPASVMMYDLERMENYMLPKEFHMHGEDLAFALDVMSRGQEWFTLPGAAFDQDGVIETTIPLDPHDPVARRIDIENAAKRYPDIHPYLRESVRNKAGGVMRVGMLWSRWYKDTGSEPINIPLTDLI